MECSQEAPQSCWQDPVTTPVRFPNCQAAQGGAGESTRATSVSSGTTPQQVWALGARPAVKLDVWRQHLQMPCGITRCPTLAVSCRGYACRCAYDPP
eukprot:scaffold305_cov247-Pinguiococcus_pyrenoidosus.AAC.30